MEISGNQNVSFSKYLKPKYIFTFSSLNYLQAGFSFLVSIFLARQLNKEDFGYFSYGMIFANTLYVIMQFGTDKTLVRDLVQLEKPNLIISSAAWLWLILGLCIVTSIYIWVIFFAGLNFKASLLVICCSALGFVRGMSPMPWFDFKGKANYHSIIILIDRCLFIGGTLAIIFFYKNERAVINVAIVQLISRTVALLIEWKFVANTTKLIIKPVYTFLKKIIKDNIWVWLAALGNLLMTQANQLILNKKFGPKELAVYGLSFQTIMLIRLLQTQILRLLTPTIAEVTNNVKKNPAEVKRKIFRYCLLMLALSSILIFIAYLFTPWFIDTFLGKSYHSAITVLNILYIWILLFGVAIIINQFLIGLRLQRFFFISTTLFGLLSILLAYLFVDKYKVMGAAISLLIAHACSIIFQLIVVLVFINKKDDIQKTLE